MTAGKTDQVELARRFVACARGLAAEARTQADVDGETTPMSSVIDRALARVPEARVFTEAAVLRELEAMNARAAMVVGRWFDAPWALEARARKEMARVEVEIGGVKEPLARAMLRYRSDEEDVRRAARSVIDRTLEAAADRVDLRSIVEKIPSLPSVRADTRRRMEAAAATPSATVGAAGLLVPTNELIESFALAAGSQDPALAEALIAAALGQGAPAAASITRNVSTLIASQSSGAQLREAAASEPPTDAAVAPTVPTATMQLIRELGDSVGRRSPTTFGAWRAARSGSGVADFRPSAELSLLRSSSQAIALPFEQPLAPIGRAGAATRSGLDATSAFASLLSAGGSHGDYAIGGALSLTAPTTAFLERGMGDRPTDRDRVSRTFALSAAMAFLDAVLGELSAGDPEQLRDRYQEGIACAPSAQLAVWWAAEHALERAPGEETALYAHSGAKIIDAFLRGVAIVEVLREAFDEDWFRNPRASAETIRSIAQAATPASEERLAAWLRGVTR
jgi:hypothetical protein